MKPLPLKKDNPSFSEEIPGLQVFWDSTSLGAFKSCPRKYQYQMLEGIVPKGERLALKFGILVHSGIEEYERNRGQGWDFAVRRAVRKVLEDSGERAEDGTWTRWTSGDPKNLRTLDTLVRTVIWHSLHYFSESYTTAKTSEGVPLVEHSFKIQLGRVAPSGEAYILCGHLDRVVDSDTGVWVMDHKTTGYSLDERYFAQFSPDPQVSMYSLANRVIFGKKSRGVIIDGIELKVTFTRFMRSPISRTPPQLDEWVTDLEYWISKAEDYALSGYWPMNDSACDKYGGCPYRNICKKDPSIREAIKSAEYEPHHWDPSTPR